VAEVCNSLDDDCDGSTDEEGVCERCTPGVVNSTERLAEQWVRACPGEYAMGSPADEPLRDPDEEQHLVELTRPFLIKATEVTVAEYRACHTDGMCREPSTNDGGCNGLWEAGRGEDPINCVAWYDAVAWCNWASAEAGLEECYLAPDDGLAYDGSDAAAGRTPDWAGALDCTGFRLPTEAEWEYAARAGTDGMFYACAAGACDDGNMERCDALNPDLDEVALYCANAQRGTAPVGSKAHPNAWGLNDPLGNVWEWVWDWLADDYGGHLGMAEAKPDPIGPPNGDLRVVRGGSWTSRARYCRLANRSRLRPFDRNHLFGFRPARTLPRHSDP